MVFFKALKNIPEGQLINIIQNIKKVNRDSFKIPYLKQQHVIGI